MNGELDQSSPEGKILIANMQAYFQSELSKFRDEISKPFDTNQREITSLKKRVESLENQLYNMDELQEFCKKFGQRRTTTRFSRRLALKYKYELTPLEGYIDSNMRFLELLVDDEAFEGKLFKVSKVFNFMKKNMENCNYLKGLMKNMDEKWNYLGKQDVMGFREILEASTKTLSELKVNGDEFRKLTQEHELFEKIEHTPTINHWNHPQERRTPSDKTEHDEL